jgi:hypothetical protein
MRYNQPFDQPSNPNAPYVDGEPAAGIEGSIVPAASVEFDQREIVEVIQTAFNRNYTDFSGAACAAPSNIDLTQLRKAIEGFFRTLPTPSWYIDTPVSFTVHGSGADFPDLNSAFEYLSKYIITHNGSVTLNITAGRWSYGGAGVVLDHANADRILVTGANLISNPVNGDFAVTGGSAAARLNDRTHTLNQLRTRFATELDFSGAGIRSSSLGMRIQNLLLVGDRAPYAASPIAASGLLAVQNGLLYAANISCCNGGANAIGISGGSLNLIDGSFLSGSGAALHGIGLGAGGDFWHGQNTNVWMTSNDANGIGAGFNCGANGYAATWANGNGGAGIMCSIIGQFQVGPNSQFYLNAGNGVFVDQGVFYCESGAFQQNGGAGLYVVVGSSAQVGGASASYFSGNGGGYNVACGAGSYCYLPGVGGVAGSSSPPVNTPSGGSGGGYVLN